MAGKRLLTIEQRVAFLEQEVARLRDQVEQNGNGSSRPSGGWIDQVAGSMKDFPEFEKVLELGRAFRRGELDGAGGGAAGDTKRKK
jgi:hypothetical protein